MSGQTIQSLYFENATDAVTLFYGLVNARDYGAAFGCLTDGFRTRVWKNDAADFAKGYRYTRGIHDVSMTPIDGKQLADTAEYHVNFSNDVDALRHPLMNDLPKATLGDLPEAIQNIRDFNTLMVDTLGADQKEIDKILIRHYFEENNVETCLWLAKADYTKNDALFTRQPLTLATYRRAVCTRAEQGWQIEALRYR